MATSITTIYNSIMENKNSREELNDLNSTSQVAIYKLWAFVISVAIFTHELLWDLFRDEINDILDSRINGTSEWYSSKALEYQDGDELKVLNNGLSLGYDPVVPDNRIVTRAAYFEDTVNFKGRLNLKLAKGDADNLQELDTDEQGRIIKYFEKIKFAGTNINIISIQPDEIGLTDVTVYHDGVKSDEEIRDAVNTAMDNFLVNLPFDGVFYIQAFTDAIQAVDNIVDVYIVQIDRTQYSGNGDPTQEIVRKATLDAGYAIIQDHDLLKIEIDS